MTNRNIATQFKLIHIITVAVFSLLLNSSAQTADPVESDISIKPNTELYFETPNGGALCPDSLTAGSLFQISALLTESCDNGSTPLNERPVRFYISDSGCGIGAGGINLGTVLTDSDGRATLMVSASLPYFLFDSVIFRAKFDGESAPQESDPPNSTCNTEERINLSSSNDCISLAITHGCQVEDTLYEVLGVNSADVYFVRTADIDRDNYTDIVYTGQADSGLFIAYGNASGSLDPATELPSIKAAAIVLDFVNSDTLLDIVAVSSDKLYFLYNLGNRFFETDSIDLTASGLNSQTSRTTFGSSDGIASLQPAIASDYLNDDQYLDLIIAPNIIMFGDGTGQFTLGTTVPITFDAVSTCDLNHDSFTDLILTGGDSTYFYLNDGNAIFRQSTSTYTGSGSIVVPPVFAVADINRDGNCDYALVHPVDDSSGQSIFSSGLGDGNGGLISTTSIIVPGIAFSLVVADFDHDNNLDAVIASGTTGELFIYPGDGTGQFGEPTIVNVGSNGDVTYALATLDLDRDGNFDFVTGSYSGGELIVALDKQDDNDILIDQMSVAGMSYLDVTVRNPNDFIISETFSTVAGSEYHQLDVNGDGLIDERTLDFNLLAGEYCITAVLEEDAPDDAGFTLSIGIDGSQHMTVMDDYNSGGGNGLARAPETDSVTFCFDVTHIELIEPNNGSIVNVSRPQFDWSLLIDKLMSDSIAPRSAALSYDMQVDRYLDFRNPIVDVKSLASPSYLPMVSLGNDSVFYWQFRFTDGINTNDWVGPFAVGVAGLCCFGSTGNVDNDPNLLVDIADITMLISYLFLGTAPVLECSISADFDNTGNVDIGDLSLLIKYVFIDGDPLPLCP